MFPAQPTPWSPQSVHGEALTRLLQGDWQSGALGPRCGVPPLSRGTAAFPGLPGRCRGLQGPGVSLRIPEVPRGGQLVPGCGAKLGKQGPHEGEARRSAPKSSSSSASRAALPGHQAVTLSPLPASTPEHVPGFL